MISSFILFTYCYHQEDFQQYQLLFDSIQQQSTELKQILDELITRSHERTWIKNQTHGELDDSKLVDGLTGDRYYL